MKKTKLSPVSKMAQFTARLSNDRLNSVSGANDFGFMKLSGK